MSAILTHPSPGHLVVTAAALIDGAESVLILGQLKGATGLTPHGSCELRLAGDCAGLRRFVVCGTARRHGLGRMLFFKAIGIASVHGKRAVSWTVAKTNLGALEFYQAMGGKIFHEDGEEWWMGYPLEGLRIR